MKTAGSVSDALSKWGIRTFAGSQNLTGLKRHDRAIGYLESDHASTYPADDRTRVHMKARRLGRSELDTRHLHALDHRLGSEGDLKQGLAQNERRLRHRSEILVRAPVRLVGCPRADAEARRSPWVARDLPIRREEASAAALN